jgi:hypothetical protein
MVCMLFAPSTAAQTAVPTGPSPVSDPAPGARSFVERSYQAMSQRQRFHYYIDHMFSAESALRAAGGAGFGQLVDRPGEWGEGAEGYGRRFASSFGENIVESTMMFGTSSLFREDNRYFLSGESTFSARLKYAIASTLRARRDDGSLHFSFSQATSYVATAAISRAWQPPSTRGLLPATETLAVLVGAEAGFNVAREFLPKIFHTRAPVTESQNSLR